MPGIVQHLVAIRHCLDPLPATVLIPPAWSDGKADVTCTDAGLCINVAKNCRSVRLRRRGHVKQTSGGRQDDRVKNARKKFAVEYADLRSSAHHLQQMRCDIQPGRLRQQTYLTNSSHVQQQ